MPLRLRSCRQSWPRRSESRRARTLKTDHARSTVLVVDFGAQYAQLIARRVRAAGVYAEIVPHWLSAREILARRTKCRHPFGRSVERVRRRRAAGRSLALRCAGANTWHMLRISSYGYGTRRYGAQDRAAKYGSALFTVQAEAENTLLQGVQRELSVWMSHGDCVLQAPPDFTTIGTSIGAPVAAFESSSRKFAGVQFHPEVSHTASGQAILENFLFRMADCQPTWTESSIIDEQVRTIRRAVGSKQVICGLSGGVDSAGSGRDRPHGHWRPADVCIR